MDPIRACNRFSGLHVGRGGWGARMAAAAPSLAALPEACL
eukprot:COSAG04_NODE_14052_length_582_cov_4.337474_1_plen_39_part_01